MAVQIKNRELRILARYLEKKQRVCELSGRDNALAEHGLYGEIIELCEILDDNATLGGGND